MKNRNIPKQKYTPRWISEGLRLKLFSSVEIVREMNVRGCKIPVTSFSQKSSVNYRTGFNKTELECLKVVRKLIKAKKLRQINEIL